eukprot:1795322-Prymnesium_polylepis.1
MAGHTGNAARRPGGKGGGKGERVRAGSRRDRVRSHRTALHEMLQAGGGRELAPRRTRYLCPQHGAER